ncbi:hypothetical protein GcM1_183034 [Golovinomyces cichoracearum]|uniref:Uncharacterized protein n=1 Tax=Golovinomyces cichoracearum TaxID=62708 RepID=A0A420J3U9_9PEZI|nr:hypothetical protein GcM1_183034 [Golovinomyces cichoracearum]
MDAVWLINWVYRFICRRPDIKSQVTRLIDHCRALCNDPAIISPWFNLVHNTISKSNILDEDTYTFYETGIQINVGGSAKFVAASKRHIKPLGAEPGDCEWVTLIAGINAMGLSIPGACGGWDIQN